MKSLILLSALMLVAACNTTSAREFKAPDGRTAYLVQCDTVALSMADCYAEATRICPAGYELLNRTEVAGDRVIRNIEIACKG